MQCDTDKYLEHVKVVLAEVENYLKDGIPNAKANSLSSKISPLLRGDKGLSMGMDRDRLLNIHNYSFLHEAGRPIGYLVSPVDLVSLIRLGKQSLLTE